MTKEHEAQDTNEDAEEILDHHRIIDSGDHHYKGEPTLCVEEHQ
jgi:hypothetical protein